MDQETKLKEFYDKRKVIPEYPAPQVWTFRKAIEGPFYWIEKHTKKIA